jgi:ElaA protein
MSEYKKTVNWSVKSFEELAKMELHDLLQLRVDIFIVEQDCPYPEIDGKDPLCFHVLGKTEADKIVAVARIAPAGVIYQETSIGRVVTDKGLRGQGIGSELMKKSIEYCRENLEGNTIKIAAQKYLEKFYSDLGFKTISEVYMWDGIEHIDMRLHL